MGDVLNSIPSTQEQLGDVGRTTVFELIRTGELPSIKVGRRRMVPQSSIDNYIARQMDKAAGIPSLTEVG